MKTHVWARVDNLKLLELARKNRTHPTEAEAALWSVLRGKFYNVKFRRQQIIDFYIVDFVCVEKGLVIEVDGEYHNSVEQQEYDLERTEHLRSLGFTVMRFTNDEVLGNTSAVIEKIKNFVIKEMI